MKELLFLVLFLTIASILLVKSVYGLRNPSQVYCEALGYNSTIVSTAEGETEACILPSGTVDAWKFLRGEVATDYSYCKKMNYEIKTIADSTKCIRLFSDNCAVCVLPNGTEVEVTQLMGLSFAETTCGDGVCGLPENYKTCSKDCISGSYDGYCDGMGDNKCDQDCIDRGTPQMDSDCPVCGDEKCESIENFDNCPQDCQKLSVCGNNECESGETKDNCCKDCGCENNMKCVDNKCISDSCGNGRCDNGENYGNCPNDCISGLSDDYCDGIKDGLCDPDCLKSEDVDCSKSSSIIWIYAIIGVVIVALIFMIITKSRRTE